MKRILSVVALLATTSSCSSYDLGREKQISVTVDTENPTWANGVGALVQAKCANCHLPLAERSKFVPSDVPPYLFTSIRDESFFASDSAAQNKGYAMLAYRRTFEDPIAPMPKHFATPLNSSESIALKKYMENQGFGAQCASTGSTTLTYADVKSEIDASCGSCHLATNTTSPKALASLADIRSQWHAALSYIAAGAMPQGNTTYKSGTEGAKVFEWLCYSEEFQDLR